MSKSVESSTKVEDGRAQAFGDKSESSFGEKFSDSVTIEATALTRRVEGRERVQAILAAASRLYESVEFKTAPLACF
jgi:hypothetical protein